MKIYLKFGQDLLNVDVESSTSTLSGYDLNSFIKNKYKIDDFLLCTSTGIDLKLNKQITENDLFHVYPKVYGGKGGFGSLLRAFGKQIVMSTNKDACRDLTGRRIRTANRDKKLREYLEKQKEKARLKEIEKKEKEEARKRELDKKHTFCDPKYEEQKEKIANDVDEALKIYQENQKRKLESTTDDSAAGPSTSSASVDAASASTSKDVKNVKKEKPMKNMKGWYGDIEISSSSDEEEEEEQVEAPKKKLKQ